MIENRLGPESMQRADNPPTRHPSLLARHWRIVAILILGLAVALAYFAYDRDQVSRLAGSVRGSFAARRYAEARGEVGRWMRERPHSGEAQYYRAWLGLVDQQPGETVAGIDEASRLGFDPERLRALSGIYQARTGRITEAEPILREAFDRQREPRAEVARELARIYLATYRLHQAAEPIERWRALAPEDPQPYLASNEIASRLAAEPAIQIRNYEAALERSPDLDTARLGLAEQLTKARRFDEAEQQFRAYLGASPAMSPRWSGWGAMPSRAAISTEPPGTSKRPSGSSPASLTRSRNWPRPICGSGDSARRASASSSSLNSIPTITRSAIPTPRP